MCNRKTKLPALPRTRVRRGGFTLIELLVAMSVIAVLFGLVLGVAGQAISAFRVRQQEAAFDILSGALEDFARQNSLKLLRNLKGNDGDDDRPAWKHHYGKYPPIDLTDAQPPLSKNPRPDYDIGGRTILQRIVGDYLSRESPFIREDPPPLIDVGWPGRTWHRR